MASDLQTIRETADDICNKISATGDRQSVEVDGDVKAQLGELLKKLKLADLSLSGTGKYTHDEYAGVLQQDLAAALKTNSDCRLTVFMTLQAKMLKAEETAPVSGWRLTPDQAEALRIRINPIYPKPPVYIKCRTMGSDCDRFAYVLFDLLQRAGWSVPTLMTSRGGNVMMTGEQGIKIISTSNSARQLADAFQASDVGALPAELDKQGDDQHILINIGDRS